MKPKDRIKHIEILQKKINSLEVEIKQAAKHFRSYFKHSDMLISVNSIKEYNNLINKKFELKREIVLIKNLDFYDKIK